MNIEQKVEHLEAQIAAMQIPTADNHSGELALLRKNVQILSENMQEVRAQLAKDTGQDSVDIKIQRAEINELKSRVSKLVDSFNDSIVSTAGITYDNAVSESLAQSEKAIGLANDQLRYDIEAERRAITKSHLNTVIAATAKLRGL